MGKYIRCLKCSKIIECYPYDIAVLIRHIRTDHPEIELPDDVNMQYPVNENPSANNNNQTEEVPPSIQPRTQPSISSPPLSLPQDQLFPEVDLKMKETIIRSPELKPIYTRKYKINIPLTPRAPRTPRKRQLYKTSIEKWRPAKGLIYCPKCGALKKPIIKTRSEKMSYSTIGAGCILTCWPLCFLPCFPSKDYLYCAECQTFLGMYNKERNCVRPNRNFIENSIQNNSQTQTE